MFGPDDGNSESGVASVVPEPSAVDVARASDLEIRFHGSIDVGTDPREEIQVFGRWSGPVRLDSTYRRSAGSDTTTLHAVLDRPFQAGERVRVTVSDRLTPGGGRGYAWSFWAEASPTSLQYRETDRLQVRRPGEGRIQSYGAYAGDLNGDGAPDLVVPNEIPADVRVFLGDGSGGYGAFTRYRVPNGARPSSTAGADFDGDDDIDVAIGNIGSRYVTLFGGDGEGGLRHEGSLKVGSEVRSVCVLDLEGDGDEDLAATSLAEGRVSVFRNEGSWEFERTATLDAGQGEAACAVGDANGDGLSDLFIGARISQEITVLVSDGEGGFEKTWQGNAEGGPWMMASGDLDRDGRVDVVAVNAEQDRLATFFGDGEGGLRRNQILENRGFPLAVDVGDLDGDGDLDVVSSSYESARYTVFRNDGGGSLSPARELSAPAAGSCTVLQDRDGDGDLDIIGVDEARDVLLLFESP